MSGVQGDLMKRLLTYHVVSCTIVLNRIKAKTPLGRGLSTAIGGNDMAVLKYITTYSLTLQVPSSTTNEVHTRASGEGGAL